MHPVQPPAYGPGYILGKRSDLPFSRKEKSVGSFTHEQNIFCSQTTKTNTVGRHCALADHYICRQLFAGHVEGFQPMKRKKNLLQMILMIMA